MTLRGWRGPLPFLGALLALYLTVPLAVLAVHIAEGARTGLPTAGLLGALWVSILSATIATALIAVFGIPLAWRLAQPGSRIWDAVGVAIQLPLALPPLMSGILLIEVVGPYTLLGRLFGGRLTDSIAGIVIAQTFVAAPFLVISARSAFATVDPGLLELAATLGHDGWSRFRHISLRIAAPGIAAGLLLAWLRAFGEFGANLILAYHPYSLPVFTFVQFSSSGLAGTLAPTGVAVLVAAVVVGIAGALARGLRRGRGFGAERRLGRGVAGGEPPEVAACGPPPQAPAANPAPLSFDVHTRAGEFELGLAHGSSTPHLALLGPSGAGKSLTLRCLAGLRGAGSGAVTLGADELGDVAAELRGIGWVPQDATLIPGLTVWRQLTFGHGTDPALAAAWMERLGLGALRDRLPGELSGGQRQRVSLARALARAPRLLLLDEPFSALDRPVRDELRRTLRRIQREAGVTTVIVTHDPEEAAMLADEIIVIDGGHLLQAGSRGEVFERPASEHVARVLGIDNLGSGRVIRPGVVDWNGAELEVADLAIAPGTAVRWCVRAEHVEVREDDADGALLPGTIVEVLDLGLVRELTIRPDRGAELRARGASLPRECGRCRVQIDPRAISVWPER